MVRPSSGAHPSTVHRPSTPREGRTIGSQRVWRTSVRFSPLRNSRARHTRRSNRRIVVDIVHVSLRSLAAEKGLEDYVRTAFSKMLVASVGPATTEALEENGIHPDFEPSHPKMGLLVQETAERAEALLKTKR